MPTKGAKVKALQYVAKEERIKEAIKYIYAYPRTKNLWASNHFKVEYQKLCARL
jgi:hypothetical protein